jgi:hypothetical protein
MGTVSDSAHLSKDFCGSLKTSFPQSLQPKATRISQTTDECFCSTPRQFMFEDNRPHVFTLRWPFYEHVNQKQGNKNMNRVRESTKERRREKVKRQMQEINKEKRKNDYLEKGVCSIAKIRACALFHLTNSIVPSDLLSHVIQTIKELQRKKKE